MIWCCVRDSNQMGHNMGLQMASRRKHMVGREPNGQAQRRKEPAPAQVRRLLDSALSDVRHAEWGTELGRLLLNGAIDEAMYAAGKRWAEQATKYHGVIGIVPLKSSSAEGGSWGHQPDPDSPNGQDIAEGDRRAMKAHFAADAVLVACGPGVRVTVRRVCEDRQMPGGYEELLNLRIGLLRLATHWGLTNAKK
jgi:hypothetical protein